MRHFRPAYLHLAVLRPSLLRRMLAELGCVILCSVAIISTGHAQYVWLDEHNVRQYTDTPPPPGVPQERIIKGNNAPSAGIDSSALKQGQATLAEQEMDFQKRRQDAEEASEKTRLAAQERAKKLQACTQGRTAQSALASGQRLQRTGSDGEKIRLDDTARAALQRRADEAIKNCE